MDDTEIIEGVLVVSVKGFTERMENGLECVVVPGGEKFPATTCEFPIFRVG